MTYQWQRTAEGAAAPVDIEGATAATYVPVEADVDATLQVVAKAGEVTVTSAPTGTVIDADTPEPEPSDLAIESVAQSSGKTIAITFNEAVDEGVTFVVKKGSVEQSIEATAYSEDKTVVTLTLGSTIKAGEYTVEVTPAGAEEALTASFTGAVAKLSEIKFLSENLVLAADGATGTVAVQGYDQFGAEVDAKFDQLTSSNGTAALNSTDHTTVTVTPATPTTFVAGQTVVLTSVYADSTKTVSATLTISAASTAAAFEVGDLTLDTTTAAAKKLVGERITAANFAKGYYYLPVTVVDQYGTTLTADELNAMAAGNTDKKIAKTLYVTPAKAATGVAFAANEESALFTKISDDVPCALFVTGDKTSAGAATITFLSTSGVSTTKDITIEANEKIDTVTVTVPDLYQNTPAAISLAATDQYGGEVDLYDTTLSTDSNVLTIKEDSGATTTITATGASWSATKNTTDKVWTVKLTPTATTVVLTTVTATPKTTTETYSVAAEATIEGISGFDAKVATTLASGATADLENHTVFLDSYGNKVAYKAGEVDTTTGNPKYATYTGEGKNGKPDGKAYFMFSVEDEETAITLSGQKVTAANLTEEATAKLTITLYYGATTDAAWTTETKNVTFTVKPASDATYTAKIKDDQVLYVGAVAEGSSYSTTATVQVSAVDADGNAMAVSQSDIANVAVDSNVATAASGKNGWVLAPVNGKVEADGEATVTVYLTTQDDPITTIVKYSVAAPKASSAKVYVTKEGTKVKTITDDEFTIAGTQTVDGKSGYVTDAKYENGKLTGTVSDGEMTLELYDQYGIAIAAGKAEYYTSDGLEYTKEDKTTANHYELNKWTEITEKQTAVFAPGNTYKLRLSQGSYSKVWTVNIAD